jgi:hypothetical protein
LDGCEASVGFEKKEKVLFFWLIETLISFPLSFFLRIDLREWWRIGFFEALNYLLTYMISNIMVDQP